MSEFVYGVDRFYWPVVLDSDSNTIVVSESGGSGVPVSLDPGRYWAYNDSSSVESEIGLPSLWREVENKLNSNGKLFNSYQVQAADPAGSTDMTNGTVELVAGGNSFTLRFQDSDFSFPGGGSPDANAGRLFGFGKNPTNQSSSGGKITGELSAWGAWQSRTLDESGAAIRKVSDPRRNVEVSVDDKNRARAQQYNKTTLREFEYQAVPGGVVYRDRARDAGSASTARLQEGDINNALQDLYSYVSRPGDRGRMARFLVVHDQGDEGLTIPDNKWEVLRVFSIEDIKEFRKWIREQNVAGELYEVQFQSQIVEGGYRQ